MINDFTFTTPIEVSQCLCMGTKSALSFTDAADTPVDIGEYAVEESTGCCLRLPNVCNGHLF